jgi:dihydroorotate dehydrogenase
MEVLSRYARLPNSMASLYPRLVRPLLFRLDPERAHNLSIHLCRLLCRIPAATALMRYYYATPQPLLQTTIAGLHFDNPLGIAAGWDKNGRALRVLDSLGFGFAEIGSVSARPSIGNPKPRLFRLPEDQAIIVNYGLPNDGAEQVSKRLAAYISRIPIGVNIVKTNDGPASPIYSEETIIDEYLHSISLLQDHASYLMLNLSCPNAAGGDEVFARPGSITRLLRAMDSQGITRPVFLKVAPREDTASHERLLIECEGFDFVEGFCFNLPTGKPKELELRTSRSQLDHIPGAVSGKPVEALINRCIGALYNVMDPKRYAIIGAGGVFNAEDAYLKLKLGASLVQLYTGLIYCGPSIAKSINRGLVKLMQRDGFSNLSEVIGSSHKPQPKPSVDRSSNK